MADSTTSTPPPRRRLTVESNFHPHDFRHVLPPFQFELKWVVVGGGSGRIAFQSAIFICSSLLLSWAELLRYQNQTIEPPLVVVIVVKKYNLIQFAPNDALFYCCWVCGGFLLEWKRPALSSHAGCSFVPRRDVGRAERFITPRKVMIREIFFQCCVKTPFERRLKFN